MTWRLTDWRIMSGGLDGRVSWATERDKLAAQAMVARQIVGLNCESRGERENREILKTARDGHKRELDCRRLQGEWSVQQAGAAT